MIAVLSLLLLEPTLLEVTIRQLYIPNAKRIAGRAGISSCSLDGLCSPRFKKALWPFVIPERSQTSEECEVMTSELLFVVSRAINEEWFDNTRLTPSNLHDILVDLC